MKRAVFVCLALVLTVGAFAQKPAPVTRAEAAATFKDVETALRIFSNGKLKTFAPKWGAPGTVTRAEVILAFDKAFEQLRPSFKFTPRMVKFDPAVLRPGDDSARKTLEKLVSWGCVSRLGPLATNAEPTIELAQFGEAVGFLLVRFAELTHTPSSKWSPAMMYGDGG